MEKDDEKKLEVILEKINNLNSVLGRFQNQIEDLKKEIQDIKGSQVVFKDYSIQNTPEYRDKNEEIIEPVIAENLQQKEPDKTKPHTSEIEETLQDLSPEIEQIKTKPEQSNIKTPEKNPNGGNIENFIGGNLLSKLGIGMLLIGIGLFINYAVENNLISPLGRILLAYAAGIVLIGTAYWLRAKYKEFSAVLMGGGLAVIYFTTYLGYSYYEIPNNTIAFVLMLLITFYAVYEATRYNLQVIAVIGLVGAYAVPVLLGKEGGDITIFFGYITVLNVAISILVYFKKWSAVSATAFVVTWAIFISWNISQVYSDELFRTGFIFSSIYFAIFYATFIVGQADGKEDFVELKVMVNSMIFFFIGNNLILNTLPQGMGEYFGQGNPTLTLFSLANMLIHVLVASYLILSKSIFTNLINFIQFLAISFFTLSVVIYFNAQATLIIWVLEAFVLFTVGNIQKKNFYTGISILVLVLGIFELLVYWNVYFNIQQDAPGFTFLLNPHFLTSIIVVVLVAAFAFVDNKYGEKVLTADKKVNRTMQFIFILLSCGLFYFSIFNEIMYFFDLKFVQSFKKVYFEDGFESETRDYNIGYLKTSWIFIYSGFYLVFFTLLSNFVIKNKGFYDFSTILGILLMFFFLFGGFYSLNQLLNAYVTFPFAKDVNYTSFPPSDSYLNIRYFSYFSLLSAIASIMFMLRSIGEDGKKSLKSFGVVVNLFVLVLLSFELYNISVLNNAESLANIEEAKETVIKVSFTILWGLYSIGLIIYGIWRMRKVFRFTGFAIFGITLVKLFAYDLSYISTLSKIIVFISVAVIFLLTAFLYNKYKDIILAEDKD